MKRLVFALVAALVLAATTPVFAYECPMDMKAIDDALAASPSLGTEDLAKVKELRAEGEREHKSGNHDAAVAALREAKRILGLQ